MIYLEIIFGAFVIGQIVTGKFAYRKNVLLRKEHPRDFWRAVGLELFLLLGLVSYQVGFDALGEVIGGIACLAVLGFMIWVLYTILTNIPLIVRKVRANPKELLWKLFLGNEDDVR